MDHLLINYIGTQRNLDDLLSGIWKRESGKERNNRKTTYRHYEVEETYMCCITVNFSWLEGQHSERGEGEFYLKRIL